MARSLGNFITLDEIFSGNHELLEKAYSPMTIRFFLLQAHYRSTLDFSNEALRASEKGLARLMEAAGVLNDLSASENSTVDVAGLKEKIFVALSDDLNSPVAIASLFDGVKMINSIRGGTDFLTKQDIDDLKMLFNTVIFDILGLTDEKSEEGEADKVLNEVVELLLSLRVEAKNKKEWQTADRIRDGLNSLGIEVKDTKDGFEWKIKRV